VGREKYLTNTQTYTSKTINSMEQALSSEVNSLSVEYPTGYGNQRYISGNRT
jgi:hypothetical protein